jgi:DNA topoisomerase-1
MPVGRKRATVTVFPADSVASARVIGLRYTSDRVPGIVRKRHGKTFSYVTPEGQVLKDPAELRRIRSLAIPPAWTDVWICRFAEGHLQAVGRDNRGRKQYRYHPLFRQHRNQTKFSRMPGFAAVLPKIRKHVEADLQGPGLSRTKVLATVVKLLETTCIRIGNEEYVSQNESFGLTTLRNDHVTIGGETLRFHFKGKSGQIHEIKLTDRKLARIVYQCQHLPGQELFQYLDENGEPVNLHSEDVNAYLREIAGEEFTAKDFRTWIGTAQAVAELEQLGQPENISDAKRNIVEAIKRVAKKLGNRPATCKAYYIHPAILESYATGSFLDTIKGSSAREGILSREEKIALAIIENSEADDRSVVPKLKRSLA